MSRTFTKLFSSITESTVWCEPHATVRVWIAMLAKADHAGRVFAAIPGLAHLSRVTTEECEAAIATFLAPDKYSRTPDFEGRRVEQIDGGWRLLNHAKYRALRDEESVKESKRNYINNRRAKEREDAPGVENVEHSRTLSAHAEAEAEADTSKARSKACAASANRGHRLPADWEPSDDDVTFAVDRRVNWREELEAFRDYWDSKPGREACKTNWSKTWRNWVRKARSDVKPQQAPAKSATRNSLEAVWRVVDAMANQGSGNGFVQAPLLETSGMSRLGHGGRDRRGVD